MRHSLRCGSIDGFLATRSSFVHGWRARAGTVASQAPLSPTRWCRAPSAFARVQACQWAQARAGCHSCSAVACLS